MGRASIGTGLTNMSEKTATMTIKMEEQLPRYLRPLVAPYYYECYWFELFECLRKVALTGITTFAPRGSIGQLVMGLVLCVLFSWAFHNLKPYKSDENDSLAQMCQAVVFFVIISKLNLLGEHQATVLALAMTLGACQDSAMLGGASTRSLTPVPPQTQGLHSQTCQG